MRVVMLKTLPGSPDGIRVSEYFEGKEYDLPADLAANFLGQHACEEVGELGAEPEAKAAPAPSKNKAVKGGKKNKGG